MPRRLSHSGNIVHHVLNRGVRRTTLFQSTAEYCSFLGNVSAACVKVPMRILALELMPNHWHLVLWPHNDGDLSRFIGRFTLAHTYRWHRARQSRGTGPVYQGRFQAIPVQSDRHLITVCRYVERNAVRAGLAQRAQDWPWGSAAEYWDPDWPPLHPWPISRPANWLDILNTPEPDNVLETLRASVVRTQPYGDEGWRRSLASTPIMIGDTDR